MVSNKMEVTHAISVLGTMLATEMPMAIKRIRAIKRVFILLAFVELTLPPLMVSVVVSNFFELLRGSGELLFPRLATIIVAGL
jgi:hypothetical protein